jgi:hypothetical protein
MGRPRLPYAAALLRAIERRGWIVEDSGYDMVAIVKGDVVGWVDLVHKVRIINERAWDDVRAALAEVAPNER